MLGFKHPLILAVTYHYSPTNEKYFILNYEIIFKQIFENIGSPWQINDRSLYVMVIKRIGTIILTVMSTCPDTMLVSHLNYFFISGAIGQHWYQQKMTKTHTGAALLTDKGLELKWCILMTPFNGFLINAFSLNTILSLWQKYPLIGLQVPHCDDDIGDISWHQNWHQGSHLKSHLLAHWSHLGLHRRLIWISLHASIEIKLSWTYFDLSFA